MSGSPLLRAALQQLSVAAWTTDENLLVTSREGSETLAVATLLAGEDADATLIALHRGALDGQRQERELRLGSRTYRVQVEPLREPDGRIVGCTGLASDITDHRRSDELLVLIEQRRRDAERIAQIGSWEWNMTTGVVVWSEELCRIFGVDPAETPSYELWMQRIHPEDRERCHATASQALAAGVPYEFSHRVVRPDGTERIVHCHGARLPATAGAPERVVGTSLDITERSRAEAERERLLATTRQALVARDEFISVASHELQTPVAALLLAVQAMARSVAAGPAAEQEQMMKVADRSARRVATLAEQLLDLTRLRAGRLELQLGDLDLVELTQDIVHRFAEPLARVGARANLVAPVPVVGRWDRVRLEQVLTNLLTNVVKYAPGKPVHIEVTRVGEQARLVVADEGIGISADRLPHVFEPYERAVSARHYGGLGLGLYVVRTVVEAHGGTVGAESRAGEWTRITVQLPLHPSP